MTELTNKTGSVSTYYVLDDIASKFRSYKINQILVRGLLFDEIKSLSGYLGKKVSLKQLIVSYSDAIRLEVVDGSRMDIDELELADFHNILLASSILTMDDISWTSIKLCTKCKSSVNYTFSIDSLDYSQPLTLGLPIELGDYKVHPLRVKDRIALDGDLEILCSEFSETFEYEIPLHVFEELLSYAVSLEWDNRGHLLANVNALNNDFKMLEDLKVVNKDLSISLLPVSVTCESCGEVSESKYNFDTLRGYL